MKRLATLLVVLIALTVIAIIVERPRIEERKLISEGKSPSKKLFPGFKKDETTKIEISDGVTTKTLSKDGDNWMVSTDGEHSFKADKTKVDELLSNVTEDLSDENIASSSSDKFKQFEVEEGTGTSVSIFAEGDKPTAKFFVGKQGPTFGTTFVRKDGENNTYSIQRQLSEIYGKDLNGWRDKHLWNFDPTLVNEAVFKFDGVEYHVKKNDKGWDLLSPETGPANEVKISSELKSLSELEGAGFEEKSIEEAGLSNPDAEIILTLPEGKILRSFFSKEQMSYINSYLEGASDTIFKIPNTTFAPLRITAVSQLKMEEKKEEAAAANGNPAPPSESGRETPSAPASPPAGGKGEGQANPEGK